MMLQNETADANEDLEHFKDIIENEDNTPAPDDRDNKRHDADAANQDSVSSDEPESSGSDEDDFDEQEDLLKGGIVVKAENSKLNSDHEVYDVNQRIFPGGYKPQHSEPSFS